MPPVVSAPRQIVPGATYLVTRRCSERRFFMRPSARTNAILRYCLALALQRYPPILVHAYCFLSNHVHGTFTDLRGVLPEFMRYLDEMIARAMNAALGRWEAFWAPGSYSAVRLETPADIVDKTAYTLANPVTARLVPRARRWPGVRSDTRDIGAGPILALRPPGFFREDGPTPESCSFQVTRPPGFTSDDDFAEQVEREVRRREDEVAAAGDHFLGEAVILAQDPTASPASFEPRRRLDPHVACRDTERRIAALQRLKEFRRAYRDAWLRLREGLREVVFPAGTYWLRVHLGIACAPL